MLKSSMSQVEEQGPTQLVGGVVPNVNTVNNGAPNGQFDEGGINAPEVPHQHPHPHHDPKLDEKKSDEPPKIKRPMNPFMIFGCEKRRKLAQVHPRMHNSEISKILGAEWKRMSEYEKAPYIQEAKRLKEQHSIEYPNYKFKANRRKPRQAVKKERAAFPYGTDLNALPTGMKFPYPSPFFQETMYGSMYPGMPSSSHPAYTTMYGDYTSALARQAMAAGTVVRTAQPPSSTTGSGTTEYYSLNKSAGTPMNEYYAAVPANKSGEYYPPTMHSSPGTGARTERAAGEVNIDRYGSTSDTRQFESRYSSTFNGGAAGSQASSAGYSANNLPSLSSETTYPIYEQRH